MSFGSAPVSYRTAPQEHPPEILRNPGMSIPYVPGQLHQRIVDAKCKFADWKRAALKFRLVCYELLLRQVRRVLGEAKDIDANHLTGSASYNCSMRCDRNDRCQNNCGGCQCRGHLRACL